jgi:hypothetical protein
VRRKLVAPTTWNPADKSAGITLSPNNLVATYSSGSGVQGVRSVSSKSAGKWVYEVLLTLGSGSYSSTGAGISTGSASFTGLGSNASGGAIAYCNNGPVYSNTSRILNNSGWILNSNQYMMAAVDMDNKKVWFTTTGAGGVWNTTPSDNPATNTGGISIAGLSGAIYAVGVITTGTGQAFTANFKGPFQLSAPAGFLAWG